MNTNISTAKGRLPLFGRMLLLLLFVGLNGLVDQAYAQCTARSFTQLNWIANVRARDPQTTYYANPTNASSYSDYTTPCIPYDYGINDLQMSFTASASGNYLGIFIDANGNGIFENSELENPDLATLTPMNGTTYNVALSPGFTGTLAMRLILSTQPIVDGCTDISDGEVEDYTICFSNSCNAQSNSQNVWIANVRARDPQTTYYANPTNASSYSDYTTPCIPYDYGINDLQMSFTASASGNYLGIFIDANGNGIFENSELENPDLATLTPMNGTTYNVALSPGFTGTLAMRLILSTQPIVDGCTDISDGEVEDYTICFSNSCNAQSNSQNVWIANVRARDGVTTYYANPTGASAYSDYTTPCIPYDYGINDLLMSFTASAPGNYLGIFIDANGNGIFENSELENPDLATVTPMNGTTYNIALSPGFTGTLAMRLILSTQPIVDGCTDIADGEVEDYTICFSESCTAQSEDQGVWISNVRARDGVTTYYDNPTGASAYSDYTDPCIPWDYSIANLVLSFTASTSGNYLGVYLDTNNDGEFDQSECLNPGLANGTPMGSTTSNFVLPTGLTGTLALRVILSTNPIYDPCDDVANGEVEDYTVCFTDGCTPASLNQNVWISNVRARTPWQTFYANPSGASAYSDYTDPCIPFDQNIPWLVLSINVSHPGLYLGVWIDFNDNGDFEASELLTPGLLNSPMSGTGINIGIPPQCGEHAMRIITSTQPITGPCDDPADGEVEDYTICFNKCGKGGEGRKTAEIDQQAEGITLFPNPAQDATQLRITLETARALSVQVMDMRGRIVAMPQRGSRMEAGSHTFRIATQGLQAGMYFVQVRGEGFERQVKLIVR